MPKKRRPEIHDSVVRALFSVTCNRCAFFDGRSGCENPLFEPGWKRVAADICHIEAHSPEGPRFNPSMTDEERRAYDNLIVLCKYHHTIVDDAQPELFPPERLREMKRRHEQSCAASSWPTKAILDQIVEVLRIEHGRSYVIAGEDASGGSRAGVTVRASGGGIVDGGADMRGTGDLTVEGEVDAGPGADITVRPSQVRGQGIVNRPEPSYLATEDGEVLTTESGERLVVDEPELQGALPPDDLETGYLQRLASLEADAASAAEHLADFRGDSEEDTTDVEDRYAEHIEEMRREHDEELRGPEGYPDYRDDAPFTSGIIAEQEQAELEPRNLES